MTKHTIVGLALIALGTAPALAWLLPDGRPSALPVRLRRSDAPRKVFATFPENTAFRRRLRALLTEPALLE